MHALYRGIRNPYLLGTAFLVLGLISFGVITYAEPAPKVASEEQLYDLNYWKSRVGRVGAPSAYEEAVRSVPEGSSLKTYHEIGHVVGAAIYQEVGLDGVVACDAATVFGCFHEIIRLYMDEYETKDLSPLADRCDELLGDLSWMCKHSIGHGLMLQNGDSIEALRQSLSSCDTISPLEYMESCHAGAFMEYDYDMTDPGDLGSARPLNADNIYSPCYDVDRKYFDQCLRRRPYWWVVALGDKPLEDKYARMMAMCRNSKIQGKAHAECINAIAIQITMFEGGGDAASRRCRDASETDEERLICETEWQKAVATLITNAK